MRALIQDLLYLLNVVVVQDEIQMMEKKISTLGQKIINRRQVDEIKREHGLFCEICTAASKKTTP